ncbi:hypothetical protein GWK47_044157 [Chionoecetes opilio]|uniref:Uncharacterized protein n=1 Tax=Chionoecetes opilio TaxID=41210 RepID=A0A8J5CVI7_CHIOP|nr:hypothetical protein GWK47_044157 [Chionoecetes opilio]
MRVRRPGVEGLEVCGLFGHAGKLHCPQSGHGPFALPHSTPIARSTLSERRSTGMASRSLTSCDSAGRGEASEPCGGLLGTHDGPCSGVECTMEPFRPVLPLAILAHFDCRLCAAVRLGVNVLYEPSAAHSQVSVSPWIPWLVRFVPHSHTLLWDAERLKPRTEHRDRR